MEQIRVLIAIVLSFLVFFVYEMVFVKREPAEKQPEVQMQKGLETKETTEIEASKPDIKEKNETVKSEMEISGSPDIEGPKKEIKTVTIETPLYTAEISENGAKLASFLLKNYKEKVGDNAPLKEMIPGEIIGGIITQEFKEKSVSGLGNAIFSSRFEGDNINVYDNSETISFYWVSPEGIEFEKEYTFSPDTYLIDMKIKVRNETNKTFKDNLCVKIQQYLNIDKTRYGFEGASGLISGKMERIKSDDIEDNNEISGNIEWIGIETQYFIIGIITENPREGEMRVSLKQKNVVESAMVETKKQFNPGTQSVYGYNLYLGPKSMKILGEMNNGLDRTINFGMFDLLAKPFLWCMNFIYEYIPNYGIAIIILTIFIKILLWPLGNKSYKSMAEMKKLQPLVTELKEKYKDDKKKMNQETMALYRTYKVNPLGGCLPMVLQIPVFIAFYRMLYEAIELRHAYFFGWINDLSAPDRLFRFDFAIPLMQQPYGIPVLTLIMGGTMFLQQKMAPPPGDPSQAKIMMFMPLIFTIIFVNFSSGLVLYWLVNNILSVGQQYYVQKKKA